MARVLYTVQDIVDQVRAQLDEANADSVDTQQDILASVNRAQDYAFDILATRYPEPILTYGFMPLLSNVAEYDIADDVFEDRILKIEVQVPSVSPQQAVVGENNIGSTYREIQRISYRDISNYESASRTNVPYYYAIYGRKIRFVPTPTGTYGVRIWSLRNPEKLVLPQGRVTVVNPASNYVIVDDTGPDLSTEADKLQCYCNVIDGQTGEIKGTLQIQSMQNNRITFRSVPTRDIVLGRPITGNLSTVDIALDDYLSTVDGICVPYYGQPTANFMIQYAVSEITRKLGGQADSEESILQKFEKQVERTWTGREIQLRVKKRSQNWGVPQRRWYFE